MQALLKQLLPLLPQLAGVFAPQLIDLLVKFKARTGIDPLAPTLTPEQKAARDAAITTGFEQHFSEIVGDMDAWDAAHPKQG